ncbi:MAG: helix-turn-helix transcriptional regulator [Cyclobacteriaceae bacterium]|nr:helix-turn-helix transcriptional regulator [Cyclobacteriaceae bacterium]
MKKKNKRMTTFEREMLNTGFKEDFDKAYQEFALQELLATMAEGDAKSVRALAKEAGLHPNAIQNLKSGKTSDIKMTSFLKIAKVYGYTLKLVKGKRHIPVASKATASRQTV